jgi:hypothetical protein
MNIMRNETDNRSAVRKADKSPSRAVVAGDALPCLGMPPRDDGHGITDAFTSYCATITKVYGERFCPTRAEWDAMCSAPRAPQRRLTDDEFDDEQARIEGTWR